MQNSIQTILVVLGTISFVILLLTLPLYFLWNWLVPAIFGGPVITFWQALGLNFLTSILFKNNVSLNSKNS